MFVDNGDLTCEPKPSCGGADTPPTQPQVGSWLLAPLLPARTGVAARESAPNTALVCERHECTSLIGGGESRVRLRPADTRQASGRNAQSRTFYNSLLLCESICGGQRSLRVSRLTDYVMKAEPDETRSVLGPLTVSDSLAQVPRGTKRAASASAD
ncbi:hypothetical protein NDU88_003278 [Pleurodeles waltl]|uniref:Uncharacterized protein n=1 Tax=Pleurodeles waltl TaxID=8319 RepID=A0AAV7UFP7_PLEWA|nr:hypothetical protein NDU88_003278 [Pleurodeles waltl]